MEILGLIKIGIATKDLEKTVSVLTDTMGVEAGETVSYAPFGMKYRILKLGDFHIEVMEPTDPNGPIGRFIAQNGEGLQHMAFRVADVEQAMAEAKSRGARFTTSAPSQLNTAMGRMKFAFINPRVSNGVLIQFIEMLE